MNLPVYVAAPWKHREAARAVAEQIGAVDGIVVTSRWLREHGNATNPAELAAEAVHDLEDVYKSHAILLLNYEMSEGKSVEQGVALALQMPIIALGDIAVGNNVFHYLPDYTWVKNVDEAIIELLKIGIEIAAAQG